MKKVLISLLIVVSMSVTACSIKIGGTLEKSDSKSENLDKVSKSSTDGITESATETKFKDETVHKINLNLDSLHVLADIPYTIEISESNFNYNILDEYENIPLITNIDVKESQKGLTVTGKETGVSVIRIKKKGFEPEELTIYTHECTHLSDAQKQAVGETIDGKIDVVAIDSTVYTDYVDPFKKKLVFSQMDNIKTLESVDGESHWVTITDMKSRIYWAFYDAMNNLKAMDFTLTYPNSSLKTNLVKQCEENLFDMLKHLKGSGIKNKGDYYTVKFDYESEDGTVLPEFTIKREYS